MSILKIYKSEEEIEGFFYKNNKHKSFAFEKAISNCIKKELPISLYNLLIEYEQIIDKVNSKNDSAKG